MRWLFTRKVFILQYSHRSISFIQLLTLLNLLLCRESSLTTDTIENISIWHLWQIDCCGCSLVGIVVKTNLTWSKSHFDFQECLIAVCKQILCLPRIDSYNAEQKMAGRSKRHFHLKNDFWTLQSSAWKRALTNVIAYLNWKLSTLILNPLNECLYIYSWSLTVLHTRKFFVTCWPY